MKQLITVVAGSKYPDSIFRFEVEADVINHLAIVRLPEGVVGSGKWTLTHVPTGRRMGRPMSAKSRVIAFRKALFAAYPDMDWAAYSEQNFSEMMGYSAHVLRWLNYIYMDAEEREWLDEKRLEKEGEADHAT